MAVGRFQVMALLQAARAYALGLPLETSYSWGLNRAIFIAAAKRGFKGGSQEGAGKRKGGATSAAVYFLGDDMAFREKKGGVLRFKIGGKVQTKEDFERQVKSRFGSFFGPAWREALAYVKSFDREVLLAADRFFREAYRPRRDELAEKWTKAAKESDAGVRQL